MSQKEILITQEYLDLPKVGYFNHYWRHTCHKFWVLMFGLKFALLIFYRCLIHDLSKYGLEEAKGFASSKDTTGLPYGHDYCILSGREIKPTIHLHKTRNRHHPEFHKHGVNGMSLLDFVEMAVDWKAAGRKNKNGNWNESIALNATRYGLNRQVIDILKKGI